MNTVEFIGNLGQDAEMKQINEETSLVEFSVATSEVIRRKGNTFTSTSWHQCKLFFENGTKVDLKPLKKGSSVKVKGSLNYNRYEKVVGKTKVPVTQAFINVSSVDPE